jgi:predicted Zn finger-like uncharacterized protein
MPEFVTCPDCRRKLRVPDDMLGKKVKCPDCKGTFLAAAGGITADPAADDYEVLPRKAGRRGEDDRGPAEAPRERRLRKAEARAGWRAVATGLQLNIYGTYALLGVLGVTFVGSLLWVLMVLIAGKVGSGGGFLILLFMLAIILMIAGCLGAVAAFVLGSVGHGFFLKTPSEPGSGLWGLALTTVLLWFGVVVLSLLGSCGGCFITAASKGLLAPVGGCMGMLGWVMMLAWFFVFWVFMRKLCVASRNEELARGPIYLMIVFPAYNIIAPLVLALLMFLAGAGLYAVISRSEDLDATDAIGPVAILVLLFWFGFWAVEFCLLIWATFLLKRVRGAVEQQIRRA